MNVTTTTTDYRETEMTKKFIYLTEINSSIKSTLETTKKYIEFINKYIEGICTSGIKKVQ